MSEPSRCAYCERTGEALTREHVFPQALVPSGEPRSTFSAKSLSFFYAQLTIKDTCEKCNNGVLSNLDMLASSVIKPHLQRFRRDEDLAFSIEIDREILCRWLLKVCFNMARITKAADLGALRAQRLFILGQRPCSSHLEVFTGLIRSCHLDEEEQRRVGHSHEWLDPELHRISLWRSPQLPQAFSISRAVTLNAMTFLVAKFRPGENKAKARAGLERGLGLTRFAAGEGRAEFRPSRLDAVSAIEAHIMKYKELYKKCWGTNVGDAGKVPETFREASRTSKGPA